MDLLSYYTWGLIMDNDIKLEKYRKLSVATLVMGIIGLGSIVLYNFLWMPISIFLSKFMEENITPAIIIPFIALVLGCYNFYAWRIDISTLNSLKDSLSKLIIL